jgi:hypothetical protein
MRAWLAPVCVILIGACSSDGTGPGNPPDVPVNLISTSLDGAVALTWDDNAFSADPDNFQNYRIYSTSHDIEQPGTDGCGSSWRLEGTTVAPEFLVGALLNGIPRCFTVSAVNLNGAESGRSAVEFDTPRPDSRNQVIYPNQVDPDSSGFRFWDDDGDNVVEAGELGRVRPGADPDIDFRLNRDASGALSFIPVRSGTGVEFYGDGPLEDLTSIDLAPCLPAQDPNDCTRYSSEPIEVFPRLGYVFEMTAGDPLLRFGAVRVTHAGPSLVILDWAFQTDPGNPQLQVGRTR